jgi:hypothetical protein
MISYITKKARDMRTVISILGCGQGFAPCMALCAIAPGPPRHMTAWVLSCVYLFRHRIPIQLTVHLDGDRANPDPSYRAGGDLLPRLARGQSRIY